MAPHSTKAAHHIQLLDAARSDGNWEAVPECIRKIKKHAPDRACLTLTAETELAIEKGSRSNTGARPTTATSSKNIDTASLLPPLLSAAEAETAHPEDRFQAQTCIGWLHWVAGEYNLAAVRLPKADELEAIQSDSGKGLADWTRVCALKSAYLRANCLARSDRRLEALATFEEGLPCLTTAQGAEPSRRQLRYWSELYLTEYCMLFSHTLELKETNLREANCLAAFRSWARYWEGHKGSSITGGFGFRGSVPRRRIWLEYYSALSTLLVDDLPYPTAFAPALPNGSFARNQLRIELKKVETAYEAILLNETEFPRAEEEREEVESLVALVMQNWSILKGRGWRDQDAGQGGKESISRGVLDILYRASMKTYHSTAILRSLFAVHLSVAEFDLAFKAFDSYLGLIKKGKARVVKTGHPEPSLDDDGTVLETVALCIAGLCRFGGRDAADKARGLAQQLEQALGKLSHATGQEDSVKLAEEGTLVTAAADQVAVAPRVIGLTFQSIGLANAQWARMTYDSSSRADLQEKAVRDLQKSLTPDFGSSANIRSIFALGIILAEQRKLGTAIDVVRAGLLSNRAPTKKIDIYNGPYWTQRALIPLWHLLALLLSARQDFVMAARACEGAFEQFQDPAILFGGESLYRSDHLNAAEAEKKAGTSSGLLTDMDDFEKQGILEVKMTQLAIIETLEGPRVAVNASLELLGLYTRLFGPLQPKTATTQGMPKSAAGTVRSVKGSIFGRNSRAATRQANLSPSEKLEAIASRPATSQTAASALAPTIHISNEKGERQEDRRARRSGSHPELRSPSTRRASLRKRDSSGSRQRRASSVGPEQQPLQHTPTVVDGETFFTPFGEGMEGSEFFHMGKKRMPSSGPPVSLARQISQVESTISMQSKESEFGEISVDGIEPTSTFMPLVHFPLDHQKRRRSAILVKVWLLIAGFYRRAEMFDEAANASAEAKKLVKGLEEDILEDTTGNLALNRTGWAEQKCVEQLWGDVWAEIGNLSLAKGEPYVARAEFESALSHFPDHPAAIVGLSNILLDIYTEKLLPPPSMPPLNLAISPGRLDGSSSAASVAVTAKQAGTAGSPFSSVPLGLAKLSLDPSKLQEGPKIDNASDNDMPTSHERRSSAPKLDPPYKAKNLPLVDRLAARDRAYGLLSGLTRLGTAWNNSEAWFALARAHEESGQPQKAKEVLWWCVELEENMAVREWDCASTGGYVL